MKRKEYTELLAPAGNQAAFYGAVCAGADAVYLGGSRFGARAYAENFTTEEILQCIRYGHLFGKKIYLTVNTLMKEPELQELYGYLQPFYEAGLDAVIVQDFGVLRKIREWFPTLEIHASTQMTLCSSFGAEMLKRMGASRIVPARELSLKELKTIRENVDIELETFIHGAMCYCYSGQCLFSSILGGRSGNRGRCAQPCRLPYRVRMKETTGREGHYLSLKDMCTVEHLPELMDAGIDSFKIEGRMKRPEYTAGVTAIYRKYMDRYIQLSENYGRAEAAERFFVEREDSRKLNSLYIRSEIHDGYYFKHNGPEMVTLSDPSYRKNDEELLNHIRVEYLSEKKKLPILMEACFRTGEPAGLTLRYADMTVTVQGSMVETAEKKPVTEENILRQLGKLGDSAFAAQKLDVYVSEDAFYPLKQLNELRREGILRLENEILRSRGYEAAHESALRAKEDLCLAGGNKTAAGADSAKIQSVRDWQRDISNVESKGYCILLETKEQLQAAADWLAEHPMQRLSCIYVSAELATKEDAETKKMLEELAERYSLLLALPHILREADRDWLKQLSSVVGGDGLFTGFLIRSADELSFLRSADKKLLRHLDANVYTWNGAALAQLAEEGADGFCLPLELTAAEQRRLLAGIPKGLEARASFEKIVYGRIPMMVTANCLLGTQGKCQKARRDRAEAVLIDRYQKEFPAVANCRHCMNIIYNSVPLFLQKECSGWKERVRLRIDFTVESKEETKQILDAFLTDEQPQLPAHTTGHEKRGVE